MYRMLTGRMPFGSKNALATIRLIQQEQPEAPRQIDMAIPTVVSDTVMDLLEKDPRARPDSAELLAECLRKKKRPPRPAGYATPPTAAHLSDRGRGWSGGWVAALMLGMAAIFAAPTIYRVSTDFGEVVVESEDPNVQVELVQGGRTVRVLDSKTEEAISVRSGKYDVKLKGDSSRLMLKRNQITLLRKDREVVTITRKPVDGETGVVVAALDTGSPAPKLQTGAGSLDTYGLAAESPPAPTYDGKSFSYWLNILKTEKSLDGTKNAIAAIGALTDESNSQAVCQAFFDFVSNSTSYSSSHRKLMIDQMIAVDPKVGVPLLEKQLQGGDKSLALIAQFISRLAYPYKPNARSVKWFDAIRPRSRVFAQTFLDLAKSADLDVRKSTENRHVVALLCQHCSDVVAEIPGLLTYMRMEQKKNPDVGQLALAVAAIDPQASKTLRPWLEQSFKGVSNRLVYEIMVAEQLGKEAEFSCPNDSAFA